MMGNYIQTLGVMKCQEILAGGHSPVIGYCLTSNCWIHKQCGSVPTAYIPEINSWSEEYAVAFVSIAEIRIELEDYDRTDYCSDIRNHISPTTLVIDK